MSNNARISSTNTNSKKPIYRKQLPGGISAAVFQNTREGRVYRSVNLQRSYKHNDNWTRMTLYMDHEHIPFMIEALTAVWQFLNDHPVSHLASDGQAYGEPLETDEPLEAA